MVTEVASCQLSAFWKNSSSFPLLIYHSKKDALGDVLGHRSTPVSAAVAWKMEYTCWLIRITRSLVEPGGWQGMGSAHRIMWPTSWGKDSSLEDYWELTFGVGLDVGQATTPTVSCQMGKSNGL